MLTGTDLYCAPESHRYIWSVVMGQFVSSDDLHDKNTSKFAEPLVGLSNLT